MDIMVMLNLIKIQVNVENGSEKSCVFCCQDKCHQYWPEERSARYQYFVVDPLAQYNMPLYVLREFKVTDARVSLIQHCRFTACYGHQVNGVKLAYIMCSLLRVCLCVCKWLTQPTASKQH